MEGGRKESNSSRSGGVKTTAKKGGTSGSRRQSRRSSYGDDHEGAIVGEMKGLMKGGEEHLQGWERPASQRLQRSYAAL